MERKKSQDDVSKKRGGAMASQRSGQSGKSRSGDPLEPMEHLGQGSPTRVSSPGQRTPEQQGGRAGKGSRTTGSSGLESGQRSVQGSEQDPLEPMEHQSGQSRPGSQQGFAQTAKPKEQSGHEGQSASGDRYTAPQSTGEGESGVLSQQNKERSAAAGRNKPQSQQQYKPEQQRGQQEGTGGKQRSDKQERSQTYGRRLDRDKS